MNDSNIDRATTAADSASIGAVYERLKREPISDDLAWWLACLDARVGELWDARLTERRKRYEAAREAGDD